LNPEFWTLTYEPWTLNPAPLTLNRYSYALTFKVAKGFALELVKWITVVRLLLGEIPEKKDLTEGGSAQRAALKPYLDLTQACTLNPEP
jgi:hypothetical protein